jgi:polar amino acid transport system substrate-binding protein
MPGRRFACPTGGASPRRRWAFRVLLAALLLAPPLTARAAAADEAPPLRLCVEADNLPFSAANGAMPGLYVELGRQIAERLGRPFEPVWTLGYFGKRTVRTTLLAGRCDGFMGLPDDPGFMGPRLIFSKPVLRLGYALVVPRDRAGAGVADLKGRRVAVQFASPPQSLLASQADVQTVTVLSPEEALRDLAEGKADAAFVWGPPAGWINKTALKDAYTVVPVEGDHMQWSAAIGFPHGQTALRDQVDAALADLGDVIEALEAKYGIPAAVPASLSLAEPAAASVPSGHLGEGATPRAVASPAGDSDEVAAGHKLFNDNCAHCHGPDAVQGERRRNLRLLRHRYGEDMDPTFMTTVTHGRVSKGMPNWSGILSDDQFHAILAYLQSVQEP